MCVMDGSSLIALSQTRYFTIVVALLYSVLYICLNAVNLFPKTSRKLQVDSNSRLVSFVNSTICVCAVFSLRRELFEVSLNLFEAAFESTPRRVFYLRSLSGYLLYDMLLCAYENEALGDLAMFIHHIVVGCALEIGCFYSAGTFHISVLLVNELSSPFLSIRSLLLNHGYKDSKYYFYNGAAFAISFFVFRIVVISALLVHVGISWWKLAFVDRLYWTRPVSDRFLFGGLSILLLFHAALNFYWFFRISLHLRRAMKRGVNISQQTRDSKAD